MKNNKQFKKVVLAYSGGLDTSIIIPWLKENYNDPEIIAVSGNVGQASELEGLEEKAIKTGASKLYIEDLTKEFLEDYVFPCVQAGALYEEYMLGTAFARPPIAKRVAEIALAEGADAICHGCTGKGNDQVRFELAIKAFAPDMPIIAPWREWDIKSREQEIDYAEAHNVPLKISRETNYSKDKNIWHLSHEGLDLEDPANEPQYNKKGFLEMGVSPEMAPDKPTYVTVAFDMKAPTFRHEMFLEYKGTRKPMPDELRSQIVPLKKMLSLMNIKCAEQEGIVFIDEIDKIAGRSGASKGPDVSREGVQRDILPLVEGCTVTTKYGTIKTDYILFICAGAFHISKIEDLIPEFQGRFPIRVELQNLNADDFYKILTVPKNALTKQYAKLFACEDVELEFSPKALEAVADKAIERQTGARGLRSIMEEVMGEIMFNVPSEEDVVKCVVGKKCVTDGVEPALYTRKDLKKLENSDLTA